MSYLLRLSKMLYLTWYEFYADDNQYIVFNHSVGDITNIALRSLISYTHHWLTMNFQNVNDAYQLYAPSTCGISTIPHRG